MPTERQCEKCGAMLAPFGAETLCPNCMLHEAIGLEADPTAQSPAAGATSDSNETRASRQSSIVNPKVRYFGDYELLEEIAHGGMGVVYKARQTSLNRIVALKMILAGPYARKEFIQRFQAEAEAAAKLQHPNIVAIHEVGEHEGHHYFSMDYVEGQNLADFVRDRPLTVQRAAALVKTIAEAIHYAHQQGILHRDLKPSNVLIDKFDQPRVTDFGLAKQFVAQVSSPASPGGIHAAPKKSGQGRPESSQAAGTPALQNTSDLTATGQVLGTPNNMPPEQASGKRGEIGPHSDLYSLGAILYFLLTARPPFFAETFEETIFQVLNADVPSPRLLNASIPRDLETICLKCLEKEPRKRYSTAQKLAGDLRRFLANEPIDARPVRAVYRAWRWVKRKPTTAALIAVSAAAILTVLAGVVYYNTQLTERLWLSLLSEARAQRAVQNRQRAIELITGSQPDQKDSRSAEGSGTIYHPASVEAYSGTSCPAMSVEAV